MSRINFEKFNKAFSRVDEKKLKSLDDVFLQKLDDVAEQLSNKGVKFPLCFIEDLYNHSKLNTFLLESNFKFYKSEPLLDLSNNNEISDEALVCYYKFACALGCFSHKTLEPLSEIFLGAKAVSTLAKIIKSKMLKNDDFIQLFQYFTYDVKPDNDFVKFLSAPGKDKSLPNFDLLYSMNIIFPEIFFFVMKNFNKIKNSRLVSDENGDPQKLSWSDAILRFYRIFNFETLKNYSEEELTLFQLGLNIDDVEMATQTFEMAKILNVPEHILGKPLKEKTILEEIEEIKMQTKDLLGEGKKLIEKTYKKQFTFAYRNICRK